MKDILAMIDCTICGAVVTKKKATLQLHINDYNPLTDEINVTEIILCRRCYDNRR
jgi:transcription elongation factor Elf1